MQENSKEFYRGLRLIIVLNETHFKDPDTNQTEVRRQSLSVQKRKEFPNVSP